MNPTGRAAVIVPEGIVFQSQTAYKKLRAMLVDDNYLYGVISLPAGVFNPYSGVKTSILLIDKTLAKERSSILFVKLNNDGFDLGAQRREIKGSEIPDVINIFKDYQNGVDVEGRENVVLASKTAIVEQDYILLGERYLKTNNTINEWQLERLGDVCTFERRVIEDSTLPYIGMEDVESESGRISQSVLDGTNTVGSGTAYYFDSDHILYGRLRPYLNKVAMPSFIGRCSTELIPIRVGRQVLKEYLAIVLRSDKSVSYAMSTYIGARMPRTDLNAFANLEIPVPPLSIQEEIVAEIESYQRIIDGARQIVENYKPTIKIDPTWPTAKVGEVVDFISGVTLSVGDCLDPNGLPLITIADVTEDGLLNTSNIRRVNPGKTVNYLQRGDLLFNWRNGSKDLVGKTALFDLDGEYIFASFLLGIRPHANIESTFLWLLLNQYRVEKRYMQFMRQNVNGLFNRDELKDVVIPVPTVEVQYSVCCAINEEMSIVDQNNRLIEIFQQKIKDRIAEIWEA